MVEKDDKAIPCTGDESLLDEDTRQNGAENTARSMSRKHIERIVDAGVRAPINSHVTDECDDKRNKDALPDRDVTSRRCDGHQTYHATYGSTHR